MTTCRIYPHEERFIQPPAVLHESRIDIDCTVLLRHAVPCMDMAEETIRRTDLMYPLSKTLTAIMINLARPTGLVQHPERRLMRDKHVHAGRDGLNINSFRKENPDLRQITVTYWHHCCGFVRTILQIIAFLLYLQCL